MTCHRHQLLGSVQKPRVRAVKTPNKPPPLSLRAQRLHPDHGTRGLGMFSLDWGRRGRSNEPAYRWWLARTLMEWLKCSIRKMSRSRRTTWGTGAYAIGPPEYRPPQPWHDFVAQDRSPLSPPQPNDDSPPAPPQYEDSLMDQWTMDWALEQTRRRELDRLDPHPIHVGATPEMTTSGYQGKPPLHPDLEVEDQIDGAIDRRVDHDLALEDVVAREILRTPGRFGPAGPSDAGARLASQCRDPAGS